MKNLLQLRHFLQSINLRLSVGIATVLILSLFFGRLTVVRIDRAMRTGLLQSARLAAQTINIACVKTLTGTAADLNSPDYLQLKEQLAACRAETPKCRFSYLMGRKADGTVFFFADNESPGAEGYTKAA